MRLSIAILTCIVLAGSVFADTVILKDGGKVVGKVKLTRTEVEVEIRPGMKVAFPKDKVKQIIFEKTPLQEFEERFGKLQDNDAAGFYNLGLWAKEKGLKLEAQKCFEKTIQIIVFSCIQRVEDFRQGGSADHNQCSNAIGIIIVRVFLDFVQ